MIIMERNATDEQIKRVIDEILRCGLRVDVSRGEFRTIIGLIGDEKGVSFDHLAGLPGVKEVQPVESKYKLVSREYHPDSRIIKVGDVVIGGGEPVFIAGPCAIEGREQMLKTAEEAKSAGANILRGGAFKPRSSVHSFQGLQEEGLKYLAEAGEKFNMPTITEVRGEGQVELVAQYVDILQIGARNMYNQDLLEAVAKMGKPVLLKRNFGAGIEEFLCFAEYIVAQGNKDIILCERGLVPIGKGKEYTRYMLDLSAVPVLKKETYLPVFADPSHGTGRRDLVEPMSRAAIAAGADGLMIETHCNPQEALCDSQQMIMADELKRIIDVCIKIRKIM
jgi:3-deoxy-7-phosphoheptulonate synthase